MFVLDVARRMKGLLTAMSSLVTNRPPDNLPHLSRPRLVAAVVGVALAYAKARTSRAVAATCPNEQLRQESNTDPATGQPYDKGLPDCRAYEMVSPVEKGGAAAGLTLSVGGGAISADGNMITFSGLGHGALEGPFVATRTALGWTSQPAAPGESDFTPELSEEATCTLTELHTSRVGAFCALRNANGTSWYTPYYREDPSSTAQIANNPVYEGSSVDLSHLVFQMLSPGEHLLPGDNSSNETESTNGAAGIYEVVGAGTSSPRLQLVNVDNEGNYLPVGESGGIGGGRLLSASQYQAISQDGGTIFFTTTTRVGGDSTIYARVDGASTVAISNPSPSECTTCSTEGKAATFQAASADGTKVFFTTEQQLLNSDTDATSDLYEYDFARPPGHNLIQVSAGGAGDPTPGAGAEVQGVVAVSSDGSHVYFTARGVLTTLPNGDGQVAAAGAENAYVYDTDTGQTQFVAQLAGSELDAASPHLAQTTPDGRYLVFDTSARLTADDTSEAQDVYRYDAQTGELSRVSIGEPQLPCLQRQQHRRKRDHQLAQFRSRRRRVRGRQQPRQSPVDQR